MIDLRLDPQGLQHAVARAKERHILIPTFEQLCRPSRIPSAIQARLAEVALCEVNPLNLFRIGWHNEPVARGGGFGPPNLLEFPSALTGTKARILGLAGAWFPTGAHKVGAAFGCLVPRLVTGQFDPTRQKAVWPSTGNYCRGGVYDSALLGCQSIAVLPEGMSQERFDWLQEMDCQIIRTPGSESNVKEIFDKCKELRQTGQDLAIFNQFEEFGNYLWHYHVTGSALAEVLETQLRPRQQYRGLVLATGSAGTLAAGDRLKSLFPASKVAAVEARQCPTLLCNGFGEHRIEGIGDKHVPWIHNCQNTDVVIALDDEASISAFRLFNSQPGLDYLADQGLPSALLERLNWLGISCVANLLAAIRFAHYFELDQDDVVLTVFTDSATMYGSRLKAYDAERGPLDACRAASIHHRYILGQGQDQLEELTYRQRQRIHNLKYYTWVEQQSKSLQDLQAQWYRRDYWSSLPALIQQIDPLIEEFNARTGLAP